MAESAEAGKIFGLPIEGEGAEAVLKRIARGGEGFWIVTANPEILLEARKNVAYRSVLRQADMRTADGFGLYAALRLLRRKVARLTGVELSEHLLQYAWQQGLKVGLFGGENGEAEEAAKKIRETYEGLNLYAEEGARVTAHGEEDSATEEARMRMMLYGPDILLVAMGAPRQEFWIAKHREDFPALKAIVGVGGTFTFWAERIKRAPIWMRSFGFEWLWRLIQEPRRWRRIWNAVVVFPALFFAERMFPVKD